ncbi:MAG: OmpA family protein [Muribaculaceae bacterium]|nr:OmpA family protein [Muribaculaceae bacterium]
MKRVFLTLALVSAVIGSSAQSSYLPGGFGSNWSIGIDAGVGTPMEHHKFFGDMRPIMGLHFQKQISPAFALGIECNTGINTSSWTTGNVLYRNVLGVQVAPMHRSKTLFDKLYVGAYGSINMMRLFSPLQDRVFELELTAGAGWGHEFYSRMSLFPYDIQTPDQNYFVTKVGVNFNFNVGEYLTLSLKPFLAWNMTGTEYRPIDVEQTTAAYKSVRGTFNVLAGVSYNFGPGFKNTNPADNSEIDELNAKVNAMRSELSACQTALAAEEARMADLNRQLSDCRKNSKKEVAVNNVETILYVYYDLASPVIRESQKPVVEMVADYLKHNPKATVVIKGYASKEGAEAFNEKLSAERADAVTEMLKTKYGIAADRIKAEGCGILTQFKELSWNRVAICIIEKN